MIKKYNHKIMKTKTNDIMIIDKKLKANKWKSIFLNKEKLPFFNVGEFEYFGSIPKIMYKSFFRYNNFIIYQRISNHNSRTFSTSTQHYKPMDSKRHSI